jgi:hypothetical protein
MSGQLHDPQGVEQQETAQTSPPRSARIAATMTSFGVTVVLLALIFSGSRGLRDFDSALIGYAVATIFTVAALAYRYMLWIQRPPTWRYFRAGWTNFLSFRNFKHYTLLIPRAWWTDIFAQTFILQRSVFRWLMHMCIFWGVILSLAITVPLTGKQAGTARDRQESRRIKSASLYAKCVNNPQEGDPLMYTLDNGKHGRAPTSEAEHKQEPFWRVAPVAKAALLI